MAALTEPVWDVDIEDQMDVALDSWKVLQEMVKRMRHQQVHPFYIEKIEEASNYFGYAFNVLKEVRPNFPKEPDV
jgi:hypothetical protein